MIHLFFVTSTSEAKESIHRINCLPKTDSFSIISNNPLANLFFAAHQLIFRDSGDFFPVGKKLRSHQLKITDVSKQWAKLSGIDQLLKYRGYQLDDIVGFSLFIYLAEVEHSLLVVENILKNVNPDVIHVSQRWTESPFRRYQTEELNLENLALEELSRLNHIKINPLSQKTDVSFPIKNTLKIAAKFISSLLKYFPVRQNAINPSAISPLVILANYYQLINLFPFLSRLKDRHLDFTAIGKTDPDQLELLNKSGIPFFPAGSTRNGSSAIQAVRCFYLWQRLKPRMAQLFNSYHPLYWNLIKEKLRYLFTIEFPQITGYLDQAEKIFSHKPKILLTMATSDTFSRCFVAAADRYGTKIIELQHGLVVFDEEAPFRKNDIHAVWGNPVIKIMNQGLRSRGSFAVTGFPYFDQYLKKINLGQLTDRGKEKTVLVLATFPVAADRLIAKTSPYQFLEIIFNAIKSGHDNWKIVFRPHPSNNADWVKEFAKKSKNKIVYDQRKMPLDEAIAACDLVIGNFTTAIIDAFFLKKPVLLYSFADQGSIKLNQHPLITSGAVAMFNTSDGLEHLLTKIYLDKIFVGKMKAGQKEFLKSYCSSNSKSASDRLFNFINSQLHK